MAAVAAVVGAPLLLGGLAVRPRWRVGLPERLGRHPGQVPGSLWVHGASVGEIRAAIGLLDAFAERGVPTVASTTTATGRDLLRKLRPGVPTALAPFDHPWCVERAMRRVSPRGLVLVETELWPFWIRCAAEHGVAVAIVSGRISERSFSRYRRALPLLRSTLGRITCVGARSENDRDRFIALGVPAERVHVTGDLKLEPSRDAAHLSPDLDRLLDGVPLLVAGSTHPGEEEAALSVLDAARRAELPLALVLAPRHPERLERVIAACEAAGRTPRLRSNPGDSPLRAGDVLLLDTLGELAGAYAHAAVAFVGGTLARVGGHNVLEPLQQGSPVVFGPHVSNAADAAALALASGAGFQVEDAAGLRERVLQLLSDPSKAKERADAARERLTQHRGATERTLALLERSLPALEREAASSKTFAPLA